MIGLLENEYYVEGASADEIWAVYRSHDFPKLLMVLEPDAYKSVDVLEGDGGVGTIVEIVPANGIPQKYKEEIQMLDDQHRHKSIARYPDHNRLRQYKETFKILEGEDENSCTVKYYLLFQFDDDCECYASLVPITTRRKQLKAITEYVIENRPESK